MKRNFFFAVGLALSLFACDNSHDDMYDPTWMREQYNNQWEMQFGEIDPNHTWNMAKQVKANLSIQEDALSEYTFKIYSANPLYDDDALLMAKTVVTTDAKGFAETSINFDALVGQKIFYVSRVNTHGRSLVKSFSASEGDINVSFGSPLVGSRSRAAEMGDLPIIDCPYTEAEVNTMIAEGHDLKNGDTYMNEWGGETNINSYYQIALAMGNNNGSLVTVISDTRNSLSTYDTGYYTKGEKITFDRNPDIVAYKAVWNAITEPGIVKVVIASGGVLNYNNSVSFVNLDIIVASGGTLVLNNTLDMGTNARLIIMPGGKVVDNTMNGNTLKNNDASSLVYNAGVMEDIRSYLLRVGTAYNAPNGVLIAKEITFTDDASVLTNWGKIDVGGIVGNQEGCHGTVNNGCLLRSDEIIQVKCLNQDANTAIECKLIKFETLTLRENSILRADNWSSNFTNINYAGEAGGKALVSVLNVDYVNVGADFVVNGPIYFEVNTFSDEVGKTEDEIKKMHEYTSFYKTIDDATSVNEGYGLTTVGQAELTIYPSSEDDCTGAGNIPTQTVPEPEDKPQSWTVACEDLGSIGDFDFNDVVFKVSHVSGSGEITVTPLAAGGTMTVNLYHDSVLLGEIHKLLGEDDVTKMLNTGIEGEKGYNPGSGSSITLSVDDSFTMTNNMGGFRLEILNGDGRFAAEIQGPVNGDSPQMICVPGDWKWPREWQKISDAYPDFVNWNSTNNAEWYKNSNSEYIY